MRFSRDLPRLALVFTALIGACQDAPARTALPAEPLEVLRPTRLAVDPGTMPARYEYVDSFDSIAVGGSNVLIRKAAGLVSVHSSFSRQVSSGKYVDYSSFSFSRVYAGDQSPEPWFVAAQVKGGPNVFSTRRQALHFGTLEPSSPGGIRTEYKTRARHQEVLAAARAGPEVAVLTATRGSLLRLGDYGSSLAIYDFESRDLDVVNLGPALGNDGPGGGPEARRWLALRGLQSRLR